MRWFWTPLARLAGVKGEGTLPLNLALLDVALTESWPGNVKRFAEQGSV